MWGIDPNVKPSSILSCLIGLFGGHDDSCPFLAAVMLTLLEHSGGTDHVLLSRFYFAPAPGRMGYVAAVERFLKVMAMVWAGSQVTKILRAGGALALAPFVDRGLSWFTVKFKFESEGKAFAAIAGLCFGLALILFFGLTLLWA
ncbi:hypothetical protein COCNU_03G004130 [Cocos nucifera]|uniref:Uncharacterized protein n=1 Tax=Cocos nucifera TaxID=13894 RepID=A0A8K0I201_COCNU|nr:hypothetical protein COCNU_03G004120 [Cocos nucifera]KAG1334294.1 hypothetical protein COCNU_03G004130 [Cocos nucifera]